jgi:hypothetical protein
MVSETMRMAGSARRDDRGRVAGAQEVDHGAGDAGAGPVGFLLDHGGQPILRQELFSHGHRRRARRRRPAPSRGRAPVANRSVEVDRLVGAMEIADAEMHDPRREGASA